MIARKIIICNRLVNFSFKAKYVTGKKMTSYYVWLFKLVLVVGQIVVMPTIIYIILL